MLCQNCGSENSNEAKFCKNCGNQFGNEQLKNITQKTSVFFKNDKKIVIWILVIVGLFLAAGISWGMFLTSRSNSNNSIVTNLFDSQKDTNTETFFEKASELTNLFSTCATMTSGQSCTFGGLTYGAVKAEDGRIWLDRNLGATRVAKKSEDKEAYGWYFQWGRAADGHQIPTSGATDKLSTTDTPNHDKFIESGYPYNWRSTENDNLWQEVGGINNPCPGGWRVPTASECKKLFSSANITNSSTAFSSSLKLPWAGFRVFADMFYYSFGGFWSSNFSGDQAYVAGFDLSKAAYDSRQWPVRGWPVRCIKD